MSHYCKSKLIKCDICTKYIQRKNFNRHVNEHDAKLKNFPCTKCKLIFKRYYHLIRHMSKHREEKFECSLCKKSFTRKDNLVRHLKKKS